MTFYVTVKYVLLPLLSYQHEPFNLKEKSTLTIAGYNIVLNVLVLFTSVF